MPLSYNAVHQVFAYSVNKKRQYLQNYKGFPDLWSAKSVTSILATSSLIPLNKVIFEYNQHMENDELQDIEFNWKEAIDRHSPMFFDQLHRNTIVAVLKKLVEMWAKENLPARLTDKLTKDLFKSLLRKLGRFDHWEATKRIFFTAMWNSSTFVLANIIYDIGLIVNEGVVSFRKTNHEDSLSTAVRRRFVSISKKLGYWGVCVGSSSLGYAVGSYLHRDYGGAVLKLLFEFGGGLQYSALVGV